MIGLIILAVVAAVCVIVCVLALFQGVRGWWKANINPFRMSPQDRHKMGY